MIQFDKGTLLILKFELCLFIYKFYSKALKRILRWEGAANVSATQ